MNMLLMTDFNFNVADYPFQLIHRHQSAANDDWNKYHAHQGLEFIFVHEGTGRVIINQKIYFFGPGTLMLFQPFQLHRVKAEVSKNELYTRSKFLFEPSLIDKYINTFESLKPFFHYIWKGQLSPQVINLAEQKETFNKIFDLYRLQNLSSGSITLDDFSLFVCVFLQNLKRHWNKQDDIIPNSQIRHVHHAEEIMHWIDANFHKEFSLDALAADLHLTKFHMCHLFRKATGSSISEYLMSRRLQEACLLLSTTSLSIQKITEQLGITNTSYFCQLFKKKMGSTPLEYRKTPRE